VVADAQALDGVGTTGATRLGAAGDRDRGGAVLFLLIFLRRERRSGEGWYIDRPWSRRLAWLYLLPLILIINGGLYWGFTLLGLRR
jgi:hypothetical protein